MSSSISAHPVLNLTKKGLIKVFFGGKWGFFSQSLVESPSSFGFSLQGSSQQISCLYLILSFLNEPFVEYTWKSETVFYLIWLFQKNAGIQLVEDHPCFRVDVISDLPLLPPPRANGWCYNWCLSFSKITDKSDFASAISNPST